MKKDKNVLKVVSKHELKFYEYIIFLFLEKN